MKRLGFILLVISLATTAAGQGERVFFGNLHSHTSYSDGVGTPADAYRYARYTAHLDFLALTDHNHSRADGRGEYNDGLLIATNHDLYNGTGESSAISAANRWTIDGEFVAIYGQEFSTISAGNHINVFLVPDVIDVGNGRFDLLLNQWIPAHLPADGNPPLVQLNHPADFSDASMEYGGDDFATNAAWLAALDNVAQLIEVYNGPATSEGTGLQTRNVGESAYRYYLNLGFHLAPTGNQDNHRYTWGTVTDARTGVITDQLTGANIVAALKSRHAYATTDRNLRAIFWINDHLTGDRITNPPQANSELNIRFSLADDDEPNAEYEIEVYSDETGEDEARIVETIAVMGDTPSGTVQDIRYNGGHQYVFFHVTQLAEEAGSDDEVWTAPVWFEPTGTAPVIDEEDISAYVASKNSKVYHISLNCRDAQRIKQENRVFGEQAVQGRRLHNGCPK